MTDPNETPSAEEAVDDVLEVVYMSIEQRDKVLAIIRRYGEALLRARDAEREATLDDLASTWAKALAASRERERVLALERDEALAAMSSDGADACLDNARLRAELEKLNEDGIVTAYMDAHRRAEAAEQREREALKLLEAIIYASDQCQGHRDCGHSMEPWQNARAAIERLAEGEGARSRCVGCGQAFAPIEGSPRLCGPCLRDEPRPATDAAAKP